MQSDPGRQVSGKVDNAAYRETGTPQKEQKKTDSRALCGQSALYRLSKKSQKLDVIANQSSDWCGDLQKRSKNSRF